jgi:hypothetical protein
LGLIAGSGLSWSCFFWVRCAARRSIQETKSIWVDWVKWMSFHLGPDSFVSVALSCPV